MTADRDPMTLKLRELVQRAEAEAWDGPTLAHELSHIAGPEAAGEILVRGLQYLLDIREGIVQAEQLDQRQN